MKYCLLFFTTLCFWDLTASAQTNNYKNEIGYQVDNDGFLGQGSDRYYTAGDFFFFRHALGINAKDTAKLKNKILEFELGQRIYTPQSAFVPGPRYIDRPFAGYLYFSTAINSFYSNEGNLRLEAQLAAVGPASFGEQIQDLIHKTFDFYTPGGWQYQVRNDFELNLSAQYNRLLIRQNHCDVTANSYLDLGTGIIGAGAGFTARFGRFNPLYHSLSTNSTISARKMSGNSKEFFFYGKPSINFVGYNATIQGSIFQHSSNPDETLVEKKPFVLSEQLGVSYVSGHWVADASAIYQTRETVVEIHPGHQWGTVRLLYRFN